MLTLCFGGTFNPIHHGHLICARAVAERHGFGKVLLIPSAIPPLRAAEQDMALAVDRLRMCQIAVDGDYLFDVSGIELERKSPSYTLDTVRALKAEGHHHIAWLVGGDTLPNLHRWHEAGQLVREARMIVMARPGWDYPWESLQPEFRDLKQNVTAAPLVEISASDIRQRVRAGLSIDYLTPPGVAQYIRHRRLYEV
ncbi:MAG: nicotinic acid mononucleotide adenylyltransferase [Phycisphaerales bacterium]|nr:nicotinic acid mononucleotide adenylyltransferase [Phycisphaerales bacterium]